MKESYNIVDFDQLVQGTMSMTGNEGQQFLWNEVFKLEIWHFATKPATDSSGPQPLVGELDGKRWLFLFTDGQHVRNFAEIQELANEEGQVFTIGVKPKQAVEWLEHWAEAGIYGVIFNQGEYGWFAPIPDLKPMMEQLSNIQL